MKLRTLLTISLVLNAGLLGGLAFLVRQNPQEEPAMLAATGPGRTVVAAGENRSGAHFGPVYEVLLTGNFETGRTQIFDLEQGRTFTEPGFATFNNDTKSLLKWVHSTGVDVSAVVDGRMPSCLITYHMAIVPCGKQSWSSAVASDVIVSEALSGIKKPKRTSLVVDDKPATFMFRTQDGACGLLEAQAASGGLRIRYKFALNGGGAPESEEQNL